MVLDSFFNSVFGWAVSISPLWGLIIVSFILTLITTLVYKLMTDQKAIKSMKDEMKQIRKDMKEFKSDPEKVMSLQKESMEKSLKQMKMTLKPMIITFIPLIIVFGWLKNTYSELSLSFLGITSWIWVYIIFALISSIILRKILKVH